MDMKWLHDQICDELEDCKMYAKKAMKAKEKGKAEYASVFGKIAEQELSHADMLLDICKDKEQKKEYDVHEEVWKYMKECISEEMAEAKSSLAMLK